MQHGVFFFDGFLEKENNSCLVFSFSVVLFFFIVAFFHAK